MHRPLMVHGLQKRTHPKNPALSKVRSARLEDSSRAMHVFHPGGSKLLCKVGCSVAGAGRICAATL